MKPFFSARNKTNKKLDSSVLNNFAFYLEDDEKHENDSNGETLISAIVYRSFRM